MVRFIIFGLLLEVGLATAQIKPGEAGFCTGLRSFGPKDSLNTADLRMASKDLRLKVNAKGPELHLRLEPDTRGTANDEPEDILQRVGWIRIFSCETGRLIQSLEVQSHCGSECFLRWFKVDDVNFDGSVDIAVVQEHGALWGRQTWWLYSRASGTFIANEFTKAVSTISSNGLELDPAGRNILAPILFGPGRCSRAQDIYHVERGNRLVLIHREKLTPTWNTDHTQSIGCTLTTLERVNGQMVVMKVEHRRETENP